MSSEQKASDETSVSKSSTTLKATAKEFTPSASAKEFVPSGSYKPEGESISSAAYNKNQMQQMHHQSQGKSFVPMDYMSGNFVDQQHMFAAPMGTMGMQDPYLMGQPWGMPTAFPIPIAYHPSQRITPYHPRPAMGKGAKVYNGPHQPHGNVPQRQLNSQSQISHFAHQPRPQLQQQPRSRETESKVEVESEAEILAPAPVEDDSVKVADITSTVAVEATDKEKEDVTNLSANSLPPNEAMNVDQVAESVADISIETIADEKPEITEPEVVPIPDTQAQKADVYTHERQTADTENNSTVDSGTSTVSSGSNDGMNSTGSLKLGNNKAPVPDGWRKAPQQAPQTSPDSSIQSVSPPVPSSAHSTNSAISSGNNPGAGVPTPKSEQREWTRGGKLPPKIEVHRYNKQDLLDIFTVARRRWTLLENSAENDSDPTDASVKIETSLSETALPSGSADLPKKSAESGPCPSAIAEAFGRFARDKFPVNRVPESPDNLDDGRIVFQPRKPSVLEDTSSPDYLFKQAMVIFNKLTLENFERIMGKFLEIGLERDRDQLPKIIELVVSKAQLEPNFCEMYANFCKCLYEKWSNDDKELGQSFRCKLLERCECEFEEDREKKVAAVRELELSEEDKEEKIYVLKLRYLGHMQFIGEIYRQDLVASKIMHSCIKELLESTEEEKLVCVCKLLRVIGRKLEDHDKQKKKYSRCKKYFDDMERMSLESDNYSSRVRFMFRDLIELQRSGWATRNEPEKAQKLSDLRNNTPGIGAAVGNSSNSAVNTQGRITVNTQLDGASSALNTPRSTSSMESDDGWSVAGVGKKGRNNVATPLAGFSATPLASPSVASQQQNYGQSPRHGQGQSRGGQIPPASQDARNRGASAHGQSNVDSNRHQNQRMGGSGHNRGGPSVNNSAMGLEKGRIDRNGRGDRGMNGPSTGSDNRGRRIDGGRGGQQDFNKRQGPGSGGLERREASVSSRGGESTVKSESNVSEARVLETAKTTSAATAGIDGTVDERTLNRIEMAVKEYFANNMLDEVVEVTQEIVHPNGLVPVMKHLMEVAIELKEQQLDMLIKYVSQLHTVGLTNSQQITSAVALFLESYDDIVIDVPLVGHNLGRILATFAIKNIVDLSFISSLPEESLFSSSTYAGDFVAKLCSGLVTVAALQEQASAEVKCKEIYASAELDRFISSNLSNYLRKDETLDSAKEELFKKYNITFLL